MDGASKHLIYAQSMPTTLQVSAHHCGRFMSGGRHFLLQVAKPDEFVLLANLLIVKPQDFANRMRQAECQRRSETPAGRRPFTSA
jgi:hypothetical protein